MTQAIRYLSSTNGFHPVATQYVISFARKESEFPVNKYVQLVEAPAPTFFYYELDRDQPVRMRNVNDHLFADGAERPVRGDNQFGFREVQAFTKRYDFNSTVGNQALAMAQKQWKAKQVYLDGLTSQAMIARTKNVIDVLETVGNWGVNTADVNTLNGGAGTWDLASSDSSSANFLAIKKSLMRAVNAVFSYTNNRVKFKDLRLIISPTVAEAMANTDEIHNYVKYGPAAQGKIDADDDNLNERWGLPKRLYGVEVVVEDTVYVSDLPTAGATTASTSRTYVKSDSSAVLMSRPGAIDAQAGPSFSTLQLWWYESQMKVFEFADPKHLRTELHINDQYAPVLSAAAAGYLLTSVLS